MDLTKEDVLDLLDVEPATLERWLQKGEIPCYQLQGEQRFSRLEIEDWMLSQKPYQALSVTQKTVSQAPSMGEGHFCLYRALHCAEVVENLVAHSKKEAIQLASEKIAPILQIDSQILFEMLWDREQRVATGLGRGVGLPHTRELIQKNVKDRVFVVYLDKSLDYGSFDKEFVHTLFFPFASQDKSHLRLLTRLSHWISDDRAFAFLKTRPSKQELLEFVFEWEDQSLALSPKI